MEVLTGIWGYNPVQSHSGHPSRGCSSHPAQGYSGLYPQRVERWCPITFSERFIQGLRMVFQGLGFKVVIDTGGVPREKQMLKGHTYPESYITKYTSIRRKYESPAKLATCFWRRFRGGLVFKAHRLLYHSTLDLRVIKKKKKDETAVRWRNSLRVRCMPGFVARPESGRGWNICDSC